MSVTTRTLRYPPGWPDPYKPGERRQEQGIDVALAIDVVVTAVRGEYGVGILMSTGTGLKPAPEAVALLTGHNVHAQKAVTAP